MTPAAGKRILVLEDDVLLALEAAETLEEIGATVIGPAHRVESAMRMIDTDRPDAALLDVNIIGFTSAPVASRLLAENIPFVLATGYGGESGIAGSRATIDKPYNRKQLQTAIIAIFVGASEWSAT